MAQCAKLLRTVCPKFSFVNRSACLTVPALISERRSALGHRESNFSSSAPKSKKETVVMYFMDRDGDRVEVTACVGDNLLDVAIKNDVELEVNNGGLCVDRISLTFVKANDERLETKAKVGDSLLDTVVDNDLDIDGYGACEGTLACSTCHLIFKQENYDQMPEPTDEESDMLDLAFDLQDTSRLGCQVTVTKEMDGWEVRVPSGVSDARDL